MRIRTRVLGFAASLFIAVPIIAVAQSAQASTELPVSPENIVTPESGSPEPQEKTEEPEPQSFPQTSEAQTTPQSSSITTITPFPTGTTRLAGAGRIQTAIAASERFKPGVAAVFVATSADFPDALSAAAAAALVQAPLLLTDSNALPAAVLNEVIRLSPERIYVLGGTGAVSQAVQDSLSRVALVSRLGGSSRYDTGLAIVNAIFTTTSHAIIATGATFPDALAATGAAGANGAPVILVDGQRGSLTDETLITLQNLGVSSVAIAGGPGAVSTEIEQQLSEKYSAVVRYGGSNRFATAAAINQAYFPPGSSNTLFLATGLDFPDALAGAALAGQLSSPVFITEPNCTPTAIHTQINQLGASKWVVMGGTGVLGDRAASNFECAPGPVVSSTVSPGAFCAKAYRNWYGYTSTGVLMRCTTAPNDSSLRWRAA